MADDRLKSAVEMVAWRVIENVADRNIHFEEDLHREFPDISADDFARVMNKVWEILDRPPTEAQQAAYEFLAARAET